MASALKVVGSSLSAAGTRRERWLLVRELLGGALLLASWLALWTVTWAAVAGPLRPGEAVRAEVAAIGPRS